MVIQLRDPSLQSLSSSSFSGSIGRYRTGRISRKAISQNHLSAESLLGLLRAKGAYYVADVEFAVLEEDGQLSVMKKPDREPVTRKDMKVKVSRSDLAVAVVIGGTPVQSPWTI